MYPASEIPKFGLFEIMSIFTVFFDENKREERHFGYIKIQWKDISGKIPA